MNGLVGRVAGLELEATSE